MGLTTVAILALVLTRPAAATDRTEGELLVERAQAQLNLERPLPALGLALEAIDRDPTQWAAHNQVLLACEMAGIPERAAADFSHRRTESPEVGVVWAMRRVFQRELTAADIEPLAARWPALGQVALAWASHVEGHDRAALRQLPPGLDEPLAVRLGLRAHVMLGEGREAGKLARAYARAHPERPEVLEELWIRDAPGPVERARRKLLGAVVRGVDAHRDDPRYLYRAVRLLGDARQTEAAERAADRLVALGFERPRTRGAWSRTMQSAMAKTLAMSSNPRIPPGATSERLQITADLAGLLAEQGREEEAVGVWAQLRKQQDSAEAALAQGRLLASLERWDEVLAVAERAQELAAAPAWDDGARLQTARQAVDLAEALALSARASMGLHDPRRAVGTAWLARNLDPHPRWDALWARALALEALAPSGRPATPLGTLATPGPDGARPVEEALPVLEAAARGGDLVAATLATQLAPHEGLPYALRARLQEDAGHIEAAFASWAIAGSLDQDAAAGLARTYRGIAHPEPGAMATVARWADALDAHADEVARLHPAEGRGTEGNPRGLPRPRVGRAMPRWTAGGWNGRVSSTDLSGKAYVLTVWASWCAPCRQELPELDRVVASLEAEGLAVAGVAISVDEEERSAQRFWQRGGYGTLRPGWRPGFEAELRIGGLPTAYVVARDGTVVHQQLGYSEAFAQQVERILRRHAP